MNRSRRLAAWLLAHHPARLVGSSERGAILVEYTMLIAFIVVICLAAVTQFGAKVPASSFSQIANSI